jgi:hypothetical protein
LRSVAAELLDVQLTRLPRDNPVERFGVALAEDLPQLLDDQPAYHLYAFATIRQCGAAWDTAAAFLAWLAESADGDVAEAAEAFGSLAAGSKTLLFKLARASATGRPLDSTPAITELAAGWDRAVRLLGVR